MDQEEPNRRDEILINYLIKNPCLWSKSDLDFRNRGLKEFKWKEVATKMNMPAHLAVRRYKTLCERFRREMIKQSSIPDYKSSWALFEKFAALKDIQSSEDRKPKIKTEIDVTNYCNEDMANYCNGNNRHDGFMDEFDEEANNDQSMNETAQRIHVDVEPNFIGSSSDTIASFCTFLEASLKQMSDDQSDALIEDISMLLFRKKREFKTSPTS